MTAYRKAVHEQMTAAADFVAAGKCASFEDYRAKCGEISGLKRALDSFTDVVKRHGEIEDDE